jgi:hypothetical protein
MEPDRSRHAACKLNTALRLVAGKDVRVPMRAFPTFRPSRFARALQMANSALDLPPPFARGRTLVSGPSLACMSGELDYFRDRVARRALRFLSMKQPFFVVSGEPFVSLASQIGSDHDSVPRLRLATHCVVIVTASYRGMPALFRVGRCKEGRAEVSRQTSGLRVADSTPGLQGIVPRRLADTRDMADLQVSVESLLPGATPPFDWKHIDAIWELWLSGAQSDGHPGRPNLEQELTQVCELFSAQCSAIWVFKKLLLDWHATLRMPGAVTHGDLWLGNVLFSGASVVGIVDWEWARRDGLRILDALHLLFMSHSVSRRIGVDATLRSFWSDALYDRELSIRLAKLSRTFSVHKSDLKFAALLLWFDYLRQMVLRGSVPNREWCEAMISRTAPVISRWLGQKARSGA